MLDVVFVTLGILFGYKSPKKEDLRASIIMGSQIGIILAISTVILITLSMGGHSMGGIAGYIPKVFAVGYYTIWFIVGVLIGSSLLISLSIKRNPNQLT